MSLTIKQAFEALSDACANGMKNPFFVMRRLKESFADVASKVVDASGDKVTVTQTLTEGTEIGSIKVNNATTVLYAPAGGGTGNTIVEIEFENVSIQSGQSAVIDTIDTSLNVKALYGCAYDTGVGYAIPEKEMRITYNPSTGNVTLTSSGSWSNAYGTIFVVYETPSN